MPNVDTPAANSGLPHDIWGEIAELLSAFDIFSLSQACRELYSSLSRRDMWIRVLRAVCRRRGVFLPTYPVSEMSVEQLRSASARPERWHDLVRRRAAPFGSWTDYPSIIQNLTEHPAITPTRAGEFWSVPTGHWAMHLVPGGRFFVVLAPSDEVADSRDTSETAETMTVVLSIYDLGVPGVTIHHVPSIAASLSFNIPCQARALPYLLDCESKSEVMITSDSSFRVVVALPIVVGDAFHPLWIVIIFDVEFELGVGSKPLLKKHPAFTIDRRRGNVWDICLRGNRVLLRFVGLAVIWDTEKMTYVCVKVTEPFAIRDDRRLMAVLTSDHVVAIGTFTLCLWNLSLLPWMDGRRFPHINDDKNDASAYPTPDVVLPSPWRYKALPEIGVQILEVDVPALLGNRVYFEVSYESDEIQSVNRYQLDVTPHTPGSLRSTLPPASQTQEPSLSLTLISETPFPRRCFSKTGPHLAYGQICHRPGTDGGEWISYAYVSRDSTSVPLTVDNSGEEVALTMYARLGVDFPHAFCASSGRMIYIPEEQDKMKVVDYLP